ncbi:MAG: HDIG domain-containing protein [Clostridia bacterium]|nr:HDIG domain-containing protein [Clostridia bacterium]
MKVFSNKSLQKAIVLFFVSIITIGLVFYGYLPVKYDLNVGSVCENDIYAPRKFVDSYQTEYEAVLAKTSVNPVFDRDDDISKKNINNVSDFFVLIRQIRSKLIDSFGVPVKDRTPFIEELIDAEFTKFGVTLTEEEATTYLGMSESVFSYIEDKAISLTEIIMVDSVNIDGLESTVARTIESSNIQSSSYAFYSDLLDTTLCKILTPNAVFKADATQEAAQNAYNNVKNNPITVDRGTRIVAAGDIITEHIYQNLVDLELIRADELDFLFLARISVYCIALLVVAFFFIRRNLTIKNIDLKLTLIISVTFLIPIAVAIYLKSFSSIATIILFFTAIAATYLGTQNGIIISMLTLLIMWPIYDFDIEYIFIYAIGILVCSILAGAKSDNNYSAALILVTTLSVVGSSVIFNFIYSSTQNEFVQDIIFASLSSLVSVVFAIGFMPVYELLTDVVSPMKLISLSQTGNPILKKMFVECPGTSQHSVMVSNLAETAAEAIGANALLCKVASYYHDIGKLYDPLYFTENQGDYNPHNSLDCMDSVQIITNHVTYGVKLAEKNKLPQVIIDIIREHHGNTYPKYFYIKACNQAKEQGLPEPLLDDFRYSGNPPTSKESAIIMLADTCEAAIKSAHINNTTDAEAFIRKLVKEKIAEDQMKDSGLSFNDIEKIIMSFVQVYTGLFHERIKYPE